MIETWISASSHERQQRVRAQAHLRNRCCVQGFGRTRVPRLPDELAPYTAISRKTIGTTGPPRIASLTRIVTAMSTCRGESPTSPARRTAEDHRCEQHRNEPAVPAISVSALRPPSASAAPSVRTLGCRRSVVPRRSRACVGVIRCITRETPAPAADVRMRETEAAMAARRDEHSDPQPSARPRGPRPGKPISRDCLDCGAIPAPYPYRPSPDGSPSITSTGFCRRVSVLHCDQEGQIRPSRRGIRGSPGA